MVERVGLAAESAKAMSQVAPRLLILAGATGVGKSTAAREIAAASGFSRILSTDAFEKSCVRASMWMRSCLASFVLLSWRKWGTGHRLATNV